MTLPADVRHALKVHPGDIYLVQISPGTSKFACAFGAPPRCSARDVRTLPDAETRNRVSASESHSLRR